MGNCTLTVNQTKILNHKGDASHADNDWINLVVNVNNTLVLNNTIALSNPKFAGQSQVNIFGDGDSAIPWGFTVPCTDQDTVMATYTIVNLSAYALDDQVTAAAQFTQQVADVIVPLYLKAATIVLGALSGGASEAIAELASGGESLLDEFSSQIGSLIDEVFQNTLIPGLAAIADFLQRLVTGRPDCNGLVLSDYVIFRPHQPTTPVHITKTYEGPQTNSNCGKPPHTFLDVTMTRQFDKIETGPLRPGGDTKHPIG
jgi:hypothetical protein